MVGKADLLAFESLDLQGLRVLQVTHLTFKAINEYFHKLPVRAMGFSMP